MKQHKCSHCDKPLPREPYYVLLGTYGQPVQRWQVCWECYLKAHRLNKNAPKPHDRTVPR